MNGVIMYKSHLFICSSCKYQEKGTVVEGIGNQLKKDINVYSFALNPEEHQPTGTCNFSRIDSSKLIMSSLTKISNIYAVNYNVLRIMSGMAGLAYAS